MLLVAGAGARTRGGVTLSHGWQRSCHRVGGSCQMCSTSSSGAAYLWCWQPVTETGRLLGYAELLSSALFHQSVYWESRQGGFRRWLCAKLSLRSEFAGVPFVGEEDNFIVLVISIPQQVSSRLHIYTVFSQFLKWGIQVVLNTQVTLKEIPFFKMHFLHLI